MSIVRDVVRRAARRLRVENTTPYLRLKKLYPRPSEVNQLTKMLASHNVSSVFDVGANVGQFGKELRLAGFGGKIVSFEPLAVAHARLVQVAQGDPNWIVAPRMAIGSADAVVSINIAGDSVSSSILDMLEVHVEAAPDSAYIGKEQVPMKRLDDVASEYLRPEDSLFLKIDVQGCESQVLQGASRLLHRVVGLHLELALVPCYRNQPTFDRVVRALEAAGFNLWLLSPGTVDEHTGRQLQVDAVFFQEHSTALGMPSEETSAALQAFFSALSNEQEAHPSL